MPKILRSKIGLFFCRRRRRAKISLSAAAKKISCSIYFYRNFEAGKLSLPLNKLAKLSGFLGIPPQDLLNLIAKLEVGFRKRNPKRLR
jgi:transcriptional regulator with XRE-family HTH domain